MAMFQSEHDKAIPCWDNDMRINIATKVCSSMTKYGKDKEDKCWMDCAKNPSSFDGHAPCKGDNTWWHKQAVVRKPGHACRDFCTVAASAYKTHQSELAPVEATADVRNSQVEDHKVNEESQVADTRHDEMCRGNVSGVLHMFVQDHDEAKSCWTNDMKIAITKKVCVNGAKSCLHDCYMQHSTLEGNAPCRDGNSTKKMRNWWYDQQYKSKTGYLCHDVCVVARAAYETTTDHSSESTLSSLII